MLQVNYIRENFDQASKGLEKRNLQNAEALLQQVIDKDDRRKQVQLDRDNLKAESNTISKEIGNMMKNGKKEEAEKIKQRTADIKAQVRALDEEHDLCEKELTALLYTIPNIPHISVPSGKSAEDNELMLEKGEIPNLAQENKLPHWELIKKYDIIDFELGVKITGAGFPVYKGKGAKLQRALVNFFLDEAEKAGYHEVQPPILINEDSGLATGQLPDKEGQMLSLIHI